jgi:hypothetical protein
MIGGTPMVGNGRVPGAKKRQQPMKEAGYSDADVASLVESKVVGVSS